MTPDLISHREAEALCPRQLFVENAFNEVNRVQEDFQPPDEDALERQLARVRVFDWLILNPDRPDNNLLYTTDWRVHLIDHSEAFFVPIPGRSGARSRVPSIDDDLKARIDFLDHSLAAIPSHRLGAHTTQNSGASSRRCFSPYG